MIIRRNRYLGRTYRCPHCRGLLTLMISQKGHCLYADADTVGAGTVVFDRRKGHTPHFVTCPNPAARRGERGQG